MKATTAAAAGFALSISGCITTNVADLGGGHYLIQGSATEYNSGQQVTNRMIAKAQEFCASRGQQARIELDHQREESGITGWYSRPASGQLSFRCVGHQDRPAPEASTAPAPASIGPSPASLAPASAGEELNPIEQAILKMCLAKAKRGSEPFQRCYDENIAIYRSKR